MRQMRKRGNLGARDPEVSRSRKLVTDYDSTQRPQKSKRQSCSQLTDGAKSEARALLRHFANQLDDQKSVDGFSAAIMAGDEGVMDYICDVLDAIHALREEFAAWMEGHTVHDHTKCKARWLLASVAEKFGEPTPQFAHEEFDNKLDAYKNLYVNDDPYVQKLICCLVRAIYDLRDDLITWGRDDLTPWEHAQEVQS